MIQLFVYSTEYQEDLGIAELQPSCKARAFSHKISADFLIPIVRKYSSSSIHIARFYHGTPKTDVPRQLILFENENVSTMLLKIPLARTLFTLYAMSRAWGPACRSLRECRRNLIGPRTQMQTQVMYTAQIANVTCDTKSELMHPMIKLISCLYFTVPHLCFPFISLFHCFSRILSFVLLLVLFSCPVVSVPHALFSLFCFYTSASEICFMT